MYIYIQVAPPKMSNFSLLIFSKKIINDSLLSGILQMRPLEVVWHQDGCCSPIFNARNVRNSVKLLFNKTRSPNPKRVS